MQNLRTFIICHLRFRNRILMKLYTRSMYNADCIITYDQNMNSIFHNDLILLNGFVLQIVYTAKKNYECSIFSSEGFLRKPLIGSCCSIAAAQKQPSLAQLATGGAAATQARARGLGDGCWSSNSSPLPSCSFFPPYSHPTPNLVLGF